MTQQITSSISKPVQDVSLPLPLAHVIVLYAAWRSWSLGNSAVWFIFHLKVLSFPCEFYWRPVQRPWIKSLLLLLSRDVRSGSLRLLSWAPKCVLTPSAWVTPLILTRAQGFKISEALVVDVSIKGRFVHFTASAPQGTGCLFVTDSCRVKECTFCPSAGFVIRMLNKTENPSSWHPCEHFLTNMSTYQWLLHNHPEWFVLF